MNQDRVKPGKGYPSQEQQDAEILTYLIDGELRHQDSLGNEAVLRAGSLQCMSAGTGMHTRNSTPRRPRMRICCISASSQRERPDTGLRTEALRSRREARQVAIARLSRRRGRFRGRPPGRAHLRRAVSRGPASRARITQESPRVPPRGARLHRGERNAAECWRRRQDQSAGECGPAAWARTPT